MSLGTRYQSDRSSDRRKEDGTQWPDICRTIWPAGTYAQDALLLLRPFDYQRAMMEICGEGASALLLILDWIVAQHGLWSVRLEIVR